MIGRIRVGTLLLFVATIMTVVYLPQQVQAGGPNFGRAADETYYTGEVKSAYVLLDNSTDPGFIATHGTYQGLATASDIALGNMTRDIFIAQIHDRLFAAGDTFNAKRTSILVNMMLGYDGTDPAFNGPDRRVQGLGVAQSRFNDWRQLIVDYDAAGLINYNDVFGDYAYEWSGATDGWSGGLFGAPINPQPDATYHYNARDFLTGGSVVILNTARTKVLVTILKECANMVGDVQALPPITPPSALGCAGATVSVGLVAAGGTANVRVTVAGSAGDNPNPGTVRVTNASGFLANSAINYGPFDAVSNMFVAVTPVVVAGSGSYSATWTAAGGAVSCSGSFNVYSKPYFQVFGGDVNVGSGYATIPAVNVSGAQLLAFINGTNGTTVQFAAMAADKIDQVTTGVGSPAAGQAPGFVPKSLAFANTTASVYGGEFGSVGVMPDFGSVAWPPVAGPYPHVVAGHTVAAVEQLLVPGDVYITGNILYSMLGSWDLSSMPKFTVIAQGGNIYIDHTVTQLNGTYVAIPKADGSLGVIYTCTVGAAVPSAVDVRSNCGAQLTVTGAFVARQVKLLRWLNGIDNLAPNGGGEQFIYSPESWLPHSGAVGAGALKYDSATSLPPVL